MEHLLKKSKCSIFHNIFKYGIFQKALLWSKGLNSRIFRYGIYFSSWNVKITIASVIIIIVLKPTFDCNIECQYINILMLHIKG